jgi:2-C-methyl-D-erythritol 2,4-cyclodiphosphate synthase
MRIGHGYDAHRLVYGRKLILCGVLVPHDTGLDGNSDADVAAHALIDAILGAAGMGDIGVLFPPTAEYEGADSIELLKEAWSRVVQRGYGLVNCDITIVAQKPTLRGFIGDMKKNIAAALETKIENINIKATTEEKMGFTGSGEGISAHAVVLLD